MWNGTLVNSPVFCGVPAVSMSMHHRVDRSLKVKAWALTTFNRIAAGAMFDATLARRGRRHSPGLVQGRPKGRHLRGNDPAKPDVGCASWPEVRVPESTNRLSMTSTEIEESEMSHTASGPAVNKDGELANISCRRPGLRTSMTRAGGNRTPSCSPTSSSRRNSAGRPDPWRSGSGRAVEARLLLRRSGVPIEERPGVMASPTPEMNQWSNGRVLFTVGGWSFVETSTSSAPRLTGNSRMPVRNWSTMRLLLQPTWRGRGRNRF